MTVGSTTPLRAYLEAGDPASSRNGRIIATSVSRIGPLHVYAIEVSADGVAAAGTHPAH